MRRASNKKTYPFMRWAFILFLVLLAVYVPLKIYIARSEGGSSAPSDTYTISIFLTNELYGHGEPCG